MRLRHLVALAACVVGTAGTAEAAGSSLLSEPFGVYGFDCDGCVDVKYAPAPIYRRYGVRRARYGRVLRVRG